MAICKLPPSSINREVALLILVPLLGEGLPDPSQPIHPIITKIAKPCLLTLRLQDEVELCAEPHYSGEELDGQAERHHTHECVQEQGQNVGDSDDLSDSDDDSSIDSSSEIDDDSSIESISDRA